MPPLEIGINLPFLHKMTSFVCVSGGVATSNEKHIQLLILEKIKWRYFQPFTTPPISCSQHSCIKSDAIKIILCRFSTFYVGKKKSTFLQTAPKKGHFVAY